MFSSFLGAIRNKYRISKAKYDEFFRLCLRRKLVDFLCDERKRFKKKEKRFEQEQQILNNYNGDAIPAPLNDDTNNNNE